MACVLWKKSGSVICSVARPPPASYLFSSSSTFCPALLRYAPIASPLGPLPMIITSYCPDNCDIGYNKVHALRCSDFITTFLHNPIIAVFRNVIHCNDELPSSEGEVHSTADRSDLSLRNHIISQVAFLRDLVGSHHANVQEPSSNDGKRLAVTEEAHPRRRFHS